MAVIMSFETQCHVEAIARDLIDVLIDTEAIRVLRESLEQRKFEKLVHEVEGEIFLHELADELVNIVEAEAMKFE